MAVLASLLSFLVVVSINSYYTVQATSGLFTRPGIPACFASPHSSTQYSDIFGLCPNTCTSNNHQQYFLYCNRQFDCCYDEQGCARCCRRRDDLNQTEIGGVVMGCAAFLFILIGIAAYCSVKYCSKAPINCQPQLWKRYVDDVLEKIKEGETQNLTDHLNTIDATNSIKFTHEEEKSGTIPFLDTLIVRKPDKTVKLLVYRKKTHTDQYLHFTSHHPLQHKLGVIRTLLDRCSDIVTEENDIVKEEEHIVEALGKCGYPKWSFQKVKKQMKEKEEKKKTNKAKTKKQDKDNSKGLVILPYIKGLTESITRVFKKHKVSTAIKPMQTIRNILVHPKDKQDKLEKSEIVYKIPCKTCDKVYIGETGRKLATRLKEHSKDVEQNRKETFTRSSRKQSLTEFNKSAITDHVNQNNHIIDWEGTRVIDRESDYKTRVIKEAIHIRMSKEVMNRDEGAHQLPRVYDPIFVTECDENHKA